MKSFEERSRGTGPQLGLTIHLDVEERVIMSVSLWGFNLRGPYREEISRSGRLPSMANLTPGASFAVPSGPLGYEVRKTEGSLIVRGGGISVDWDVQLTRWFGINLAILYESARENIAGATVRRDLPYGGAEGSLSDYLLATRLSDEFNRTQLTRRVGTSYHTFTLAAVFRIGSLPKTARPKPLDFDDWFPLEKPKP